MEKETVISVRGIFRESKALFKKHFYYFFAAFIFITIINIALSIITPDTEKYSDTSLMIIAGIVAFLVSIVSIFVQIYLQIKVMRATLRTMRDPEYVPEFNNFFVREGDGRMVTKRFFITQLLSILFILGGFILFIIPGVYIAVRFSLASYIVADTSARPMDALRESWAMTKGKFWILFRYNVIVAFFAIITIIAFIVTIPLLQIMTLNLYERLAKGKNGLSQDSALV